MKVAYLFCFFVLIFASCGYKTIPTSLYESRSARKELFKGSTRSVTGDTINIPATNKMTAFSLQFSIHKFEPDFLDEENVYWVPLDKGFGVIRKIRPFPFFPKRWVIKKVSHLPTSGILKKL